MFSGRAGDIALPMSEAGVIAERQCEKPGSGRGFLGRLAWGTLLHSVGLYSVGL